jgi:hypothetical protein
VRRAPCRIPLQPEVMHFAYQLQHLSAQQVLIELYKYRIVPFFYRILDTKDLCALAQEKTDKKRT